MENLIIAVLSVIIGSVLIPLTFRYIQSRGRLNRLILELIGNEVALFLYKGRGIYVVENVAWQAAREDETIIRILLHTSSPNILRRLSNAYQYAESRAATNYEKDWAECLKRFRSAIDAFIDCMKDRTPRVFFLPLYSHKRFVRLRKAFRG